VNFFSWLGKLIFKDPTDPPETPMLGYVPLLSGVSTTGDQLIITPAVTIPANSVLVVTTVDYPANAGGPSPPSCSWNGIFNDGGFAGAAYDVSVDADSASRYIRVLTGGTAAVHIDYQFPPGLVVWNIGYISNYTRTFEAGAEDTYAGAPFNSTSSPSIISGTPATFTPDIALAYLITYGLPTDAPGVWTNGFIDDGLRTGGSALGGTATLAFAYKLSPGLGSITVGKTGITARAGIIDLEVIKDVPPTTVKLSGYTSYDLNRFDISQPIALRTPEESAAIARGDRRFMRQE
jgi:hypothetical protein